MATPEQQWFSGDRRRPDGVGGSSALPGGDEPVDGDGRFRTRRERRLAEAAAPVSPAGDVAEPVPPRVDVPWLAAPPAEPIPSSIAAPAGTTRQAPSPLFAPAPAVLAPIANSPFAPAGVAPPTVASNGSMAPVSPGRQESERWRTSDPDDTEAIPVADPSAYRTASFGAAAVDGIRYDGPPPGSNGAAPEASGAWPTDAGTSGARSPHASAQQLGPKSARKSGGRPPSSLRDRLLRDAGEVLGTVAVALAIAIVIKTFLVQPFKIPSASMEDTLLIGDRVLVSKLEPGPLSLQRGDVVVFLDPGGWLDGVDSPQQQSLPNQALTFVGLLPANSGEHLIKRVIGLPGDNIKCCDANGSLLVNNQPIDETSYLYPGDQPSAEEFQVTVPDGSLWVMGDHRSVSRDSRFHAVDGDLSAGAVPLDNVVGRAVLVSWPLERWDWLGRTDGVFDGVGQLDGVK